MAQNASSQARVVIIGGGIVGCSTAYHLAKNGWKDVVLLERGQLTCGSTFHAAGLVGQLRSSANITQILKYSVELYNTLEAETELATGWKQNGGLRLACNNERWTEVKRQATTAHSFGLEMHLLTPSEAKDLWPLMNTDDLVGAAFLPTDGQVNPSDITQSLAKGARMHGATIVENCKVEDIEVKNGEVKAVITQHGRTECDIVVNCAGIWSRKIGAMAGVNVPVQPMQHQFLVTETMEGVARNLPTLRDPDRLIYFKEEVGGLVMGGYEPNPIPWATHGIPEGFQFQLLNDDWDHFEQLMEQALIRVPSLESAGIRKLVNGPEGFTPDGAFILGEAPEVKNFFVGAGFNAYGIAAGGGAGRALAEWVMEGIPTMDLWPVDIRRFGPHHRDPNWVCTRTEEAYAHHYTMAWPHEEFVRGRPVRRSPLYDRLKQSGACFGSKLGWERPNWFAPEGVEPKDEYTFERQNWFEHVGREHKNTRENASLFDQTSFAKFLVKGPDACKALSWICANDIDKEPGTLTYTQMLNARGGIECDLTVSRIAQDEFYITTGTGYATHDFHHIKSSIPEGAQVELVDMTSSRAVLGLMGPKARDILQAATPDDVSNEALPFATWKDIALGGNLVRAMRVTFVGELGWELHIPVESAISVYELLHDVGASHGLKNAGYRAIESLRLEKGYRVWGSDITPDDTPLHAGLGWACKLKTDIDFQGRKALLELKKKPLAKRLVAFTVADPNVVLLGRETLFRDGKQVGYLASAGYGYTIEKNIGYGYVRNPDGVNKDYLTGGSYELEVAGERVPCDIHLGPLFDPKMERVKA